MTGLPLGTAETHTRATRAIIMSWVGRDRGGTLGNRAKPETCGRDNHIIFQLGGRRPSSSNYRSFRRGSAQELNLFRENKFFFFVLCESVLLLGLCEGEAARGTL